MLRPYAFSDLSMVRQASADPLIPSISSVPRTTRTRRGGPSSSASTRGPPRATASPSSIADEVDTDVGLGSIGLWLQEIESGRASIGYWLVAGARGRGLAARALEAVVSFAFGELAVPRLHLFVEPWNVASARTAEAAGFTREATLRGWERIDGEQHDADCFALLYEEWADWT